MALVKKNLLKNRPVRDILFMTAGILLVAFALDAFLVPNKIVAGGASGLGTVLYYLTEKWFGKAIPIGVQTIVLNAVLLIFVFKAGGLRYVAKTLYGILGLAVAIDVMALYVPNLAPHDVMLAAIAGGVVSGIGLGLVFKVGSNTGGTDILAQLVAPKTSLGIGQVILIADGFIILFAGFVFGAELALYGAISIAITSWIIDVVIEGLPTEKAVWIISEEADDIGAAITEGMGRGCTRMDATGVWTGMQRPVLFVVLTRREIGTLKEAIANIDSRALVVISDVHEAIGEGFKEIGVE